MKDRVSAKAIGQALGITKRAVNKRAGRGRWHYVFGQARGGREKLYIVSGLPEDVRLALAKAGVIDQVQAAAATGSAGAEIGLELARQRAERAEQARVAKERGLAAFHRLPRSRQAAAYARQDLVRALDDYLATPHDRTIKEAVATFCRLYNTDELQVPERVRRHIRQAAPSTLLRWRQILRDQGPAGLAPGYRNPKKGTTTMPPEQQQFIIGMIRKTPHCSASTMKMAMESRFATVPHVSTIGRFMARWKRENESLLLFCTNPDKWRNRHQFAIGDASEQVERLNQLWEFDSTPADVMLVDGRHSLIGVIDVYSRRLKLLVAKSSKATAVAALIRRAIMDWGVPEVAKTDNGSDYVSHHIVQVFQALEIEQRLCPPFTPEMKPHIERAFKTFAHSFQEIMPGYIGHNVAQRKDIESRKSFAQRLGQQDAAVEISMTAEELQRYCDRWCEAIYHQNPHRALDDRTPAEVARAWRGTEKRISDERALDILMAEPPRGGGFRTVTKDGVRVNRTTYISEGLPEPGTRVRVLLDQTDLGTIYLFGEDGTFLCVAQDPLRTGLDRAEVAAKLKARQKEIIREGAKKLKKIAREQAIEDIHEQILAHREGKTANIIELPKQAEEYTTAPLEQAGMAVAAMDARRRDEREIDEIMADGIMAVAEAETEAQPAPGRRHGAKAEKIVPIFASEMEWHDWLRQQEKPRGLSRHDHDRLTAFYATRTGRMCLELYGDLRKRFGLREEAGAGG